MLAKVSDNVLQAVYTRLTDATFGYNAGITTQGALYSGLDTTRLLLDFSSTSQNFCFDDVDAADMEKTGNPVYPFGCLHIAESAHTGAQRFTQFSGLVQCNFEVTLSWVPMRGMQNREMYANCFEDVVIDVMNRVENQNWGKPIVYNGGIRVVRGKTTFGGSNFVKKMMASMLFEIDQ
jgi:hypothetical protein